LGHTVAEKESSLNNDDYEKYIINEYIPQAEKLKADVF